MDIPKFEYNFDPSTKVSASLTIPSRIPKDVPDKDRILAEALRDALGDSLIELWDIIKSNEKLRVTFRTRTDTLEMIMSRPHQPDTVATFTRTDFRKGA